MFFSGRLQFCYLHPTIPDRQADTWTKSVLVQLVTGLFKQMLESTTLHLPHHRQHQFPPGIPYCTHCWPTIVQASEQWYCELRRSTSPITSLSQHSEKNSTNTYTSWGGWNVLVPHWTIAASKWTFYWYHSYRCKSGHCGNLRLLGHHVYVLHFYSLFE